ncbi:MAG: choice-of-anchor J domain-containing protein, partial [Candidatus Cloacimonetes bacterium]|nr:choice-of-anchor J domain-containing protein [Candidatus Cloacimonadota bacterium]
PAPAMILSPADGATFVNAAATLNWQASFGADGYKLYFGTTNPPAYIGDLGDVTTYNPNGMANETTYYWQVVPYNTYGEATDCPVWSFETLPAGMVIIGDGSSNQYMPVNTYYGYSYAQSIYLQEDINVANQRIEKISYYWNGVGAAPNSNEWVVYMGHTDEETFATTSDWVPVSELTPVYSGTLNIPATEGWITINLSNPFVYNNTQNLVIAVDENKPSYDGSSYFFFNTLTTGENRSLRYQSDSTNPDPASPPIGTLTAAFPNIIMEFGDLPANPIFNYTPTALDFGTLMQDTPSAWQNVIVTNTGAGTINLSANDISIFGTDATMFEFDDVNLPAAIGPGISVNIPVRATATDEGALSATLRIVYNANDYDVALSAVGLPAGTYIIGDGIATSRYPLGSYFGYERSAALYTATEMGVGNKRINTLGWFTTLASSDAVPTKIYLKSYAGSTLTADTWANLITGATPVYDDTITSIAANDWYMITLDNTFDLDSGENLLVLVERNFGGGGGSAGSTAPAIHATTMSNMHQMVQTDNNPPTGVTSAQATRPNLMFIATSYTITDPPNPAIAASPADEAEDVDVTATLNWISGGGAPDGYKLYFGNSTPPAYIGDLGDALSYNPTLAYSSTYYWQVIPYNNQGDAANCPIWSFTTMADPTVMLPVAFDFTGTATGAMPLGWERSHANWGAVTTTNAGGSSPELRMYWSPSTDANVRAITPPLYGDNEDGYILKFKHNVDHYSYGDPYTLKVEISTDKANWTTLWSMVPTASVTAEVEVPNNLGAYLEAPFYLAWTFDGNTYDINNWYVDDISITPVMSGPPAIPTLTFPADAATNMAKDGFNLTWQPDLNTGGEPTYYAVFMSQDEETIFDDFYFEVSDPSFNPITDSEGEIVFAYEDRWYWTVLAANTDGESDPAPVRSFQIEADPTIRNFPWTDSFESYADFSLDLRPWTQYDGDGMTTWGIEGTTFPNQYYVGSFIAFNPSTTTPALGSGWAPHGGNKLAAAFDANGDANDDWLITPPIQSPGALKFGFWARSVTDTYGLERFNVLISTTDTNPASFTKISEDTPYTEAPVAWTKYEYTVNVPANQIFYLAIQCVSDDAFAFFVDDVELAIPQSIDLAINGFTGDSLGQVNSPAVYDVTVANVGLTDVSSYDIYLKNNDNGSTVATMNVTELLTAGTSAVHEISWIPAFEGEYDIYAEVSTAGDTNLANNTSAPLHLTVYSENMQILYVGDPGTTWVTWAAPFNFYFEDSVAETIYLASEMQATSGTIEALVYTNYFDTADVEYFQIWMKNTDVNDLASGWLPWEGYTLVYDGPVGGPAGLNLIQIPITPFSYTGGNLAIRTSREWTGDWASDKQWLITIDENYPNRSRLVYQDTEYMDHTNPPVGSVSNNIPNVIFFMDTEDMVTSLDAPVVGISQLGTNLTLEWPAQAYAYNYNIYSSEDPYVFGDTPEMVVYGREGHIFAPALADDKAFYKVTAETYRDLTRAQVMRPVRDTLQKNFRAIDMPVHKTIKVQRASK